MNGLFKLPNDSYANRVLNDELERIRLRDINLSYPQYTEGVKKIDSWFARPTLGGWFSPKTPDVININARSNFPIPDTIAHEASHLAANNYDIFRLKAEKEGNYPADANLLGTTRYIPRVNVNLEEQLKPLMEDAYTKYKDKYKLSGSFNKNFIEFMADLIGIEASLPKGQTILDTDIGKDLFKTKELQRWYLGSSFPMTTKILEGNPQSFYEKVMDKANAAKKVFKSTAMSDSYVNSAAKALKSLTEDVSLKEILYGDQSLK